MDIEHVTGISLSIYNKDLLWFFSWNGALQPWIEGMLSHSVDPRLAHISSSSPWQNCSWDGEVTYVYHNVCYEIPHRLQIVPNETRTALPSYANAEWVGIYVDKLLWEARVPSSNCALCQWHFNTRYCWYIVLWYSGVWMWKWFVLTLI